MNTTYDKPGRELYSARNSLKPVNFYCDAPRAKCVQLAGNFNHWSPVPMQRRVDGWWFIQILLAHGHHRYRLLLDGQPILDPRAAGTARDDQNEPASLLAVI